MNDFGEYNYARFSIVTWMNVEQWDEYGPVTPWLEQLIGLVAQDRIDSAKRMLMTVNPGKLNGCTPVELNANLARHPQGTSAIGETIVTMFANQGMCHFKALSTRASVKD